MLGMKRNPCRAHVPYVESMGPKTSLFEAVITGPDIVPSLLKSVRGLTMISAVARQQPPFHYALVSSRSVGQRSARIRHYDTGG